MIEILKMQSIHVPQVAALEKLCFSEPWSENSLAGELGNPLSLWLVALDGDRVAGYVGSQSVMGETDMMNIAVAPDYRRQGVAAALIDALVKQLKANGNHCLTLEVRASNAAAIRLYEKLGFAPIGRRPNYYRSPREDALILRKEWQL
ncbi:MAG: ribosomal protein S18-alanine N-acetyltransferase [Oscillospiraceae bacterium]|nr:ribosomal protein S18-alanine N-acetyltransferase [Oscillospiraceae bacterium]